MPAVLVPGFDPHAVPGPDGDAARAVLVFHTGITDSVEAARRRLPQDVDPGRQ
ncbi:hypothetical protein ACIQOW_12250 [Kitasatospora sp. NPDC091335]|uniref:hypothetical protein n=1 Tax=Kitasatospora sp. NPDC091335 TaxID=3364085 RepID=UPI00382E834B